MAEFFEALTDPDFPLLRQVLLASVLASIAAGLVGPLIVVRRITYLAGAISHSALGGIGLAFYLSEVREMEWMRPIHGALVAGLLCAGIVGWISLNRREREDTAISTIWSVGMAIGLIFFFLTPEYNAAMNWLFGNILLITPGDLWFLGMMNLGVLAAIILYYNRFVAVSFDEEFARSRNMQVERITLLLLLLTAVTIVMLVQVTGIVLLIAMLTLPAAIATGYARSIWQIMLIAIVLGALFSFVGLGVSYHYDLPTGPCIILVAAVVYILNFGVRGVLRGKT